MKREAMNHTKMKRLCRRLDLARWQAAGLMESIWHLANREAYRGDIGKLSDEDIALGIDYRGDESEMITALVESGWLDRHETHRLLVHDWAAHCEDSVHMKMARAREFFADGTIPRLARLGEKERERAHEFYGNAHDERTVSAQTSDSCAQEDSLSALPSPPIPSHSKPSHSKPTNERASATQQKPPAKPDPPFVRSPPSPPVEIPRKPIDAPRNQKADTASPQRIAQMRSMLHGYMAMSGTPQQRVVKLPDDEIIVRCLLAVGATPLSEVGHFLSATFKGLDRNGLASLPGQSPIDPNGPKTYAWFPPVLAAAFGTKAPPGETNERKRETTGARA